MPSPSRDASDPAGVGVVEGDLSCVRCGYNLRSLAVAGRCPECGLAVGDSFRDPDDPARAPADWLRRQRRGAVWLAAGYLLSAGTVAGEMSIHATELTRAGLLPAIRILSLALVAMAAFRLTEQRADRRWRQVRALVRYSFLIAVAIALGLVFDRPDDPLARYGWAGFFTLMTAGWFGLGLAQARLARMLGAPRLAGWTLVSAVLWTAVMAATGAFYVFREFTGRSLFSRAEPWFVYLLTIGGLMLVGSAVALAARFYLARRGRPD